MIIIATDDINKSRALRLFLLLSVATVHVARDSSMAAIAAIQPAWTHAETRTA